MMMQRYSKDIEVQKKCKNKFIFEEIEFKNWSNVGKFSWLSILYEFYMNYWINKYVSIC